MMADILVVEEDRQIGDLIVEILERKGHRTARASDGLEGLGKIYAREYDLAIVDVDLPGIDGAALVKAIKKRTPETLTIVICSRADLEGVAEALRIGAYDFVVKPDIEGKLDTVIEKALGEGRRMRKSGYIHKDVRGEDGSLLAKRMILTAFDSFLAGSAFFLAFIVCVHFLKISSSIPSIHPWEIARLSLGMGFCYALLSVYRQSYKFERRVFGKLAIGQIWSNITSAYLVFLGILFLSGNTQLLSERAGVLLGYGLGFSSITAVKTIVIPFLYSRFRREGKKKIVIVGSSRRESLDSPLTFGRLDSMNPGLLRGRNRASESSREGKMRPSGARASRPAFSDEVEEIHVDAGKSSASEVLSMLDRYRGRQLKIVSQEASSQNSENADQNE